MRVERAAGLHHLPHPRRAGRVIDCERLLPLGAADKVEQIAASLQLISLQGEFRRERVLEAFDANTSVAFAGVIAGSGGRG